MKKAVMKQMCMDVRKVFQFKGKDLAKNLLFCDALKEAKERGNEAFRSEQYE